MNEDGNISIGRSGVEVILRFRCRDVYEAIGVHEKICRCAATTGEIKLRVIGITTSLSGSETEELGAHSLDQRQAL